MKKEKVPLFLIFKEDNQIKTDVSEDINDFELYGFLKIFVNRMSKNLEKDIKGRTDNEEIL